MVVDTFNSLSIPEAKWLKYCEHNQEENVSPSKLFYKNIVGVSSQEK